MLIGIYLLYNYYIYIYAKLYKCPFLPEMTGGGSSGWQRAARGPRLLGSKDEIWPANIGEIGTEHPQPTG